MTFTEYTGNRGPTDGPYRAGSDGPHGVERGVGSDCPCGHSIDRHGWSGCAASVVAGCLDGGVCTCARKPSDLLAAHVAEVSRAEERERDEFDRTQAAIMRHDQLKARAEYAEAEVAALRKQVEAVRAEHRREWADYIDQWDGAVGPEPPTARSIVAALRGPVPFGVTAALDAEAVDRRG